MILWTTAFVCALFFLVKGMRTKEKTKVEM